MRVLFILNEFYANFYQKTHWKQFLQTIYQTSHFKKLSQTITREVILNNTYKLLSEKSF